MSTKIYTGFRITGTDLQGLHRRIADFRAEATRLAEALLLQRIAALFAERVDDLILQAASPSPILWREIMKEIRQRQQMIVQTNMRDPEIDLSFSLSFAPASRNSVIGMYFTEASPLAKLWLHWPGVRDYHYQNQTDRPEYLIQRAWNDRATTWERVLRDHGALFTAEIVPVRFAPDYESLAHVPRFFPSLESRLERLARERVASDRMRRLRHQQRLTPTQQLRWTEVMASMRFAAKPEAEPLRAQNRARFARQLPTDLALLWMPGRDK